MKKLGVILLALCLLLSFSACSKKSDTKETKKATTKKEKTHKLQQIEPLTFPNGVNPADYGKKIMSKGTTLESAEDLSKKYDILIKKDFSLLERFGVNLQDVSVCCAVEKVTGCYLNYLTGKKWTTAEEFKKLWEKSIFEMPKNFYTIINDPDIPFDTKLKVANKYGYLAYPFVEDVYNFTFYSPADVCLVGNYKTTYFLKPEEEKLLSHYYENYPITEEQETNLKAYLSNYMELREQNFSVN